MGWCYEFGPQVGEQCDHPMTAGESSCMCTACGVVCTGRFAGCAAVWARGADDVPVQRPRRPGGVPAPHHDDAETIVEVIPLEFETAELHPDRADDLVTWLHSTFDEMQRDLRALGASVNERQRAIGSGDGPAPVDAGPFADALLARLQPVLQGVAEAMQVRPPAAVEQADALVEQLRHSVIEVHQLTDQLRDEMARLSAFRRALAERNPAVADLVERSAAGANERLRLPKA